MDLKKIKNLVKQNGDKFIFVENGEPEIVMMSFQEYEKLANGGHVQGRPHIHTASEPRQFEFSGSPDESFPETEFTASYNTESAGLPVRLEDIRLEDLPI